MLHVETFCNQYVHQFKQTPKFCTLLYLLSTAHHSSRNSHTSLVDMSVCNKCSFGMFLIPCGPTGASFYFSNQSISVYCIRLAKSLQNATYNKSNRQNQKSCYYYCKILIVYMPHLDKCNSIHVRQLSILWLRPFCTSNAELE